MIQCIMDPGACFAEGFSSIAAVFPLGQFGMGLIVGAVIGKFGVGALLALWVAMRSRGEEPEIYRHPDDNLSRGKRRR